MPIMCLQTAAIVKAGNSNIVYPPGEITRCHSSGEEIIVRQGMFTIYNGLKNGSCSNGEKIPGIWD